MHMDTSLTTFPYPFCHAFPPICFPFSMNLNPHANALSLILIIHFHHSQFLSFVPTRFHLSYLQIPILHTHGIRSPPHFHFIHLIIFPTIPYISLSVHFIPFPSAWSPTRWPPSFHYLSSLLWVNLRAFVLVTEPWCLTLYKWLSHSHIIAVLFLCLRLRLMNGSFHQKKENSDGYIGGV